MAYRQRMAEYHPDKVAHLGPELRELAERKATEFNLAIKYIVGFSDGAATGWGLKSGTGSVRFVKREKVLDLYKKQYLLLT
jgi:preprotein translocase subunit Sec63